MMLRCWQRTRMTHHRDTDSNRARVYELTAFWALNFRKSRMQRHQAFFAARRATSARPVSAVPIAI
jgi:hypothetical protein